MHILFGLLQPEQVRYVVIKQDHSLFRTLLLLHPEPIATIGSISTPTPTRTPTPAPYALQPALVKQEAKALPKAVYRYKTVRLTLKNLTVLLHAKNVMDPNPALTKPHPKIFLISVLQQITMVV